MKRERNWDKMKNKIKLHGTGNYGDFNFYIFDKKNYVAEVLSKIFEKTLNNKWERYNEERNKKENIEKYKDIHQNLGFGGISRIDIFYGNKKMFITIHCSKQLRLKFNMALFKVAKMPKTKRK